MKTLLIGLGNRFRHDDGAGLQFVRQFSTNMTDFVDSRLFEGDPIDLIELWQGADRVMLIDATSSGAEPGTVQRLDASEKALPEELFGRQSTHLFSIADAIELARRLEKLPQEVIIFGIEGANFSFGEGLSGEVQEVLAKLNQQVLDELAQLTASAKKESKASA
ncbi:hydrogenase maturation protease [Candidatus Acetothermia bacterium]|nr:hydrogenase maturation protease [Candidatus Acetothermia bacterium]MBI3644300.1 hydrogenase maturation protease [Candidatus Acetothermia bacterium]